VTLGCGTRGNRLAWPGHLVVAVTSATWRPTITPPCNCQPVSAAISRSPACSRDTTPLAALVHRVDRSPFRLLNLGELAAVAARHGLELRTATTLGGHPMRFTSR
jgi:hypothetical protein